MTPMMRKVVDALAGKRFPLEDEKATQQSIAYALTSNHIRFVREFQLARPGQIGWGKPSFGLIDFWLPDCSIGVEVKIKGRASEIAKQVESYTVDDRIAAVLLATSKPVSLPDAFNGKPVFVFDMARAWL